MVGSERRFPPKGGSGVEGRRPLMVGSEQDFVALLFCSQVAVPSWSGRNVLLGWSGLCGGVKVAVPSWSGRNQGKFWGFDDETKGNGKGVAVDLRLPENP